MTATRPNIVFVHVDQLHHQALSAFGTPHVHTPNMDRLVASGTAFMRAYATMPQCCPARASWFTGRMSRETGVPVNSCPIRPELPDLGQWLRTHGGYNTYYTGKWHVSGRDVASSFDVLQSSIGMGEIVDSATARSVVGFLENYSDSRPFFLSAGFLNPHDCCYTAGANGGVGKFALASRIANRLPPLPPNFDLSKTRKQKQSGAWSDTDWRYYIYSYYRWVEMVDHQVGRVYDALRASPHAANTLFLFTADHGDGLGFHANTGKGYLEEEAWRVPTIACWPDRVAVGVRDESHLASGVDIAATVCDYAQVRPLPKMTNARSWKPLLEGKSVPWRSYVVGEAHIPQASLAIRDDRYKTIFYKDGSRKHFDLQADPLEMRDLAAAPGSAECIRRHRTHFQEYIRSIELCPVPTWGTVAPGMKDHYTDYLEWYPKVLAEA